MNILNLFKKKSVKKSIVISKKEHDEWHGKHKDYDSKSGKEHDACHRKYSIVVKNKS
jgi:hypothetical protein